MRTRLLIAAALFVFALLFPSQGSGQQSAADSDGKAGVAAFVTRYCADCHHAGGGSGGLDLQAGGIADVAAHPDVWEKVVRKLRARQMPPVDAERPDERTYEKVLEQLITTIDAVSWKNPDPGRTETFRRLTRIEYQNAIRDLLHLPLDVSELLPADESAHGFDHGTLGSLSPVALDKYLAAAQKISGLAVGTAGATPGGETFRIPADLTQEEHLPGLPLGTRGGARVEYYFPADGEYEIQVRLARDRNEEVEGLRGPREHELILLLDREQLAEFVVRPPSREIGHEKVDAHLQVRATISAGAHRLGVTFLKDPTAISETKRQPYQARFNMHRHPRLHPAVYQVSIIGPFNATGPGDTASRRRIFGERPAELKGNETAARQVLMPLLRRAYRREVNDEDLRQPLEFFKQRSAAAGFDAGIEAALSAVLVSPQFLFRIEHDKPGVPAGESYSLTDAELASRLSFFLWSSIPDDALLDAALAGELRDPEQFRRHVLRMLQDPRAESLATNFAAQWLHLRNLDALTPDGRLFPDFDENLRRSLRRETELLFEKVLREDRSVLELIQSEQTHLDERLARHYSIPHVCGSRFREVDVSEGMRRGGLLRQGSVLTVTSYATRTSPVIRGKWVLDNLLGTPPPPPPANVPALAENRIAANLSVRARLTEHRANTACAGCHRLMDPVGFALENFDAVGRWRETEEGQPLDVEGGLPDGTACEGVAGLEVAILERPELFIHTLAEKLLVFALGRRLEYFDGAAVRRIVAETRAAEDRFSALILGVTTSVPFQMRRSER